MEAKAATVACPNLDDAEHFVREKQSIHVRTKCMASSMAQQGSQNEILLDNGIIKSFLSDALAPGSLFSVARPNDSASYASGH
jgi:hypothetical protein